MDALPFSRLPGINSLFLDYIQHPQRVHDFYPEGGTPNKQDITHRKELCSILERQNRAYGNVHTNALIQKLSRSDTTCVITGQQVGLLTGPMYSIWKALTAFHQAAQSNTGNVPAVPIFWMASEDHNWHEITSFALLKSNFELISFSLKDHLFLSREPTGRVSTDHPEIRKILLRALQEIRIPAVKENYSGRTLAEAFARTMLWLLPEFPMLIVDPSDVELKRLAAPFFRKFFDRRSEILEQLKTQNELLRQRNYPVQVQMEENVLPLFSINGSEREHVMVEADNSILPPEKLSPAALLRPLFQDFIFPTQAYVGGPAEIAYFAQLHPWYSVMEIEQPALLPRVSVTLLPQPIRAFLESKKLKPEELFLKEDILFDALLDNNSLDAGRRILRDLREQTSRSFEELKDHAGRLDQTLKKALDTSQRKIRYQLEKSERKFFLAAKRSNHLLGEQIRKAKNVVYPAEKLQERYVNIFSFSSRLPELISDIYAKINWELKQHQWIEI